ncbi:unnamed protein product [Heterotrigona itama]|uniref:Uncharacterized protein n=1 Tax=Heterotrigona itama TaxID=395501 RepID=A0A6V7H295_9HYME|nr:unnamed protein product [Heterotrigona itama]
MSKFLAISYSKGSSNFVQSNCTLVNCRTATRMKQERKQKGTKGRKFVRIYGIAGIIEFMALQEEGGNEPTFQEALINSHHTFYSGLERILSGTKQ